MTQIVGNQTVFIAKTQKLTCGFYNPFRQMKGLPSATLTAFSDFPAKPPPANLLSRNEGTCGPRGAFSDFPNLVVTSLKFSCRPSSCASWFFFACAHTFRRDAPLPQTQGLFVFVILLRCSHARHALVRSAPRPTPAYPHPPLVTLQCGDCISVLVRSDC